MTDGPPDIVVDFSPAWVQLSWGEDVDAWAPAAAAALWQATGQPHGVQDVAVLAATLEVMARSAFLVPCFGAFVFCPEPARGPRAVLRLTGIRCSGGTDGARLVEEILLPDGQQLLTPQVEHMSGPGLPRTRIRQRARAEEDRTISDHIAYLFPFGQGAWVLSTTLPDTAEVERWLPDLDELSAGVQLQVGA
ncbi:hypothetical protein [Blastococcus sp. TF02-8]|uniref:hypothetical protein n=1 Tax=Blastococcus sp. TF02-8 TaxID=2250574 RepID=UPI0011BFC249|nr:hypothetical protein [Blastococcus sp. TF02-8]